MANVTISITDAFSAGTTSGINISVSCNPELNPNTPPFSAARYVALCVINFMRTMGTNVPVSEGAEKFIGEGVDGGHKA